MTDKEKLKKIKELADAMYYAAFNMTTNASLLRKAMDKYHLFIIYEYYKKEPISKELEEAAEEWDESLYRSDAFKAGAKWQEAKDQETIETAIHHAYHNGRLEMKEQMMAKAIEGTARPDDNEVWCNLKFFNFKDGDKVKVIVIKED